MEVRVIQGDITTVDVDCIVNAANSGLVGGGGVDGAIHRAGGPEILAECADIVQRHGPCSPGEAVATTAGRLSAKYVVHTVGPVWGGGRSNEAALLSRCYHNSLRLGMRLGCSTFAFPNISTGVYGFPKEKAVLIVREFVDSVQNAAEFAPVSRVLFVVHDERNYQLYLQAFGADTAE